MIIAIGTAAWFLYTRYIRRGPSSGYTYFPPQPDVEDWFIDAQTKIAAMDERRIAEMENGWQALSDTERQELSDEFMLHTFGQRAISGYNLEQRLQIGRAHYLLSAVDKGQT